MVLAGVLIIWASGVSKKTISVSENYFFLSEDAFPQYRQSFLRIHNENTATYRKKEGNTLGNVKQDIVGLSHEYRRFRP